MTSPVNSAFAGLNRLLPTLEELYKTYTHIPSCRCRNLRRVLPQTSFAVLGSRYHRRRHDRRCRPASHGYGPTVTLRADMDALPIKEATGLPYASKVMAKDREGHEVPVSHMCGHDMHVTCLIGAIRLLAEAKSTWKGTLMAVFQPAEETSEGARGHDRR